MDGEWDWSYTLALAIVIVVLIQPKVGASIIVIIGISAFLIQLSQ